MLLTKARSPSKFSTTVTPAERRRTRTDGDRSTPARAQCSITTREPRSSPRTVHRPAVRPALAAALALLTAPPQENANSSVKISSPGRGSSGTCPKTSSRKTEPNEIMSKLAVLHALPAAEMSRAGSVVTVRLRICAYLDS